VPPVSPGPSRVTRENDNDNDSGDDEAGEDDRDGGDAWTIRPVRNSDGFAD
jgi:hypothetical protein